MRIIGPHKFVNLFQAVVNMKEGARLVAVTPDFDLIAILRQGNLPTKGGRCFLLAPFIGPQRTVYVVEAGHPGFQAVVLAIVLTELLQAVALLGLRRPGVLLLEGRKIGTPLLVLWTDTGRGREEETAGTVDPTGFQYVCVDQDVVADDVYVNGRDLGYPAHIRGQVVDLIELTRSCHRRSLCHRVPTFSYL
nr:hypothetical protein [Thermodesulforhabdus norvegica]